MQLAIDLDGSDDRTRIIAGIRLAIKRGDVLPGQIAVVGTIEAIEAMQQVKELAHLDSYVCGEKIGMGEKVSADTGKKDCSIVQGMNGLRDGHFDCFISAGNSAAVTFLAVSILGRMARGFFPAIAVSMPNVFGQCLLLDAGANANSTPKNLLHNGQMGSSYARIYRSIKQPRVGLINIGEEAGKGNKTIHEAYDLLAASGLNFIGYIEGRDIFIGEVDVAVTDGFTGNTILKSNEGVVKMIDSAVREESKKHRLSYIAYPFLWPMIKGLKKRFDYQEIGGAILLGVNGAVIIAHGSSQPPAIAGAIRRAKMEVETNIIKAIKKEISQETI